MKKTTHVYLLIFALTFGILCGSLLRQAAPDRAELTRATEPAAVTRTRSAAPSAVSLKRSDDTVDFSGVIFTPWDVARASANVPKRAKKPYTLMIYMNGSDLESEEGAATDDLVEMLNSGVKSDLVNLVLFTGGTNRWQNDVIPENECCLWEIQDGLLYDISGVGLVNMGDAGTLSSFIDFSVNSFPAEKYGLIMWDHGGGSIAGYGHDEKFNNSNLTLLDINYAFKRSVLANNKLELLGFDSCLMATTEMAVIASDYAKYLVASEDVEPGGGWDYSFLSALNKTPAISGAELGKEIVNRFVAYYGPYTEEILTLSVTDLSKVGALAGAVDVLMKRCQDSLLQEQTPAFNTLARKRSGTKTFGEGSPADNDCDMVDAGDMAAKLRDLYPAEADDVAKRLSECVIYNKHNSAADLKGLSLYYVYGGKKAGRDALNLYAALKTSNEHARYLNNFYSMLVSGRTAVRNRSAGTAGVAVTAGAAGAAGTSGNSLKPDEIISSVPTLWRPDNNGDFIMAGIQSSADFNSYGSSQAFPLYWFWPKINGQNVCLYEINRTDAGTTYVIPASRNGRICDIVVLFNDTYPRGKIQGVRNEDGLIIQKGFDEIKDGDKISIQYETRGYVAGSSEERWYQGPEFTVDGGVELEWAALVPDGKNFMSVLQTDVKNDRFFTELTQI